MITLIGKKCGEYEGIKYWHACFAYNLEKNGEGMWSSVEKCTEKLYNDLAVGCVYDADSMMYNKKQKLCLINPCETDE